MSERRKVLRVIARLNVGGPALHCHMLSEELTEYGFDTVLVAGTTDGAETDFAELEKWSSDRYRLIKLKKLGRVPNAFSDLMALVALVRIIREEKPDIVHTHTAKAGLLGRVAAFLTGVPVVVHTFHGHVLHGYFRPSMERALRWLERMLALKTTAIVTLSSKLRDELSTRYRVAPLEKFQIIPLGKDLSAHFSTPRRCGTFRKELSLSSDTFLMGTVGRLVPIKNQSLMLEACARLANKNWAFVFVGDGPLRGELNQQAEELGIRDRIHFIGWRADLPVVLSDLDLFVLSSRNEGTPLSIIEAFASGVPVVSTEVGGVSDLFQEKSGADCGALIPEGDVDALAGTMSIFIQDSKLLDRCSLQGRARAKDYDKSLLVKRMASLYHQLLRAV